jgi:hypothetical protein
VRLRRARTRGPEIKEPVISACGCCHLEVCHCCSEEREMVEPEAKEDQGIEPEIREKTPPCACIAEPECECLQSN